MAEKQYPDIEDEYRTSDDLEATPLDKRRELHFRELHEYFEELYGVMERLKREIGILEREAITDPLTGDLGVFNRSYFNEQLKRELSKLKKGEDDKRHGVQEYVSILFIDLNKFKNVNDKLGHIKGDEVLRETARVLLENVRPYDVVCRYGGDEFTVILPGADEHGAEVVSDRIYKSFESKVASKYVSDVEGFGISIGRATTHYQISPKELIKEADRCMYRAKRNKL